MTEPSGKPEAASDKLKSGAQGLLPYALGAGLMWLGWQAVITPLALRAPGEHAIRLTPGSHTVLARAADEELRAGRDENALELARRSLALAPFDSRAVRVLGLAEAEAGNRERADALLTLAGNWSLRDSTAHGWLVENRLQNGDYAAAFAHADTLARRRPEQAAVIYDLFATAMEADPRAVPYVADLVSNQPPWRRDFLDSLYAREGGMALAAQLALVLGGKEGEFSDTELATLYTTLFRAGQFPALVQVRDGLGRPSPQL